MQHLVEGLKSGAAAGRACGVPRSIAQSLPVVSVSAGMGLLRHSSARRAQSGGSTSGRSGGPFTPRYRIPKTWQESGRGVRRS